MAADPPGPAGILQAAGALLWKDPGRILETAEQLRGTDTVLECTLRGGSMGAAIPRGARLRIRVGRIPPYAPGEVVAFVRGDGLCVHRVAYCGRGEGAREFLVTQGDACFHPDPPVELRCVLGPVAEWRIEDSWREVAGLSSRDRADSPLGRALRGAVARLLEVDVRLARGAARLLGLHKEGPANAGH